jgi:hypothetical protein
LALSAFSNMKKGCRPFAAVQKIGMSDSEVFREVDEDYRRERMIAFWRRYGTATFGLVVIAMLVAAGANYYVERREAEKAGETARLEALLSGIQPGAEAQSADALAAFAAAASPAKATLALLAEGALRQRAGKLDDAARIYRQIADGSDADPVLRDLAVVRLGYLATDQAKPEPMIPRLQEIAARNSPWRYSAREAAALLTARAGERESAAQMFSDLARDPGAPPDLAARARALADLYRGK